MCAERLLLAARAPSLLHCAAAPSCSSQLRKTAVCARAGSAHRQSKIEARPLIGTPATCVQRATAHVSVENQWSALHMAVAKRQHMRGWSRPWAADDTWWSRLIKQPLEWRTADEIDDGPSHRRRGQRAMYVVVFPEMMVAKVSRNRVQRAQPAGTRPAAPKCQVWFGIVSFTVNETIPTPTHYLTFWNISRGVGPVVRARS